MRNIRGDVVEGHLQNREENCQRHNHYETSFSTQQAKLNPERCDQFTYSCANPFVQPGYIREGDMGHERSCRVVKFVEVRRWRTPLVIDSSGCRRQVES